MGKGFVIFLTPWPSFGAHMGAAAAELFPCATVPHNRGGGLSSLHCQRPQRSCISRPVHPALRFAHPRSPVRISRPAHSVFRLARSRVPACPLPSSGRRFPAPARAFRRGSVLPGGLRVAPLDEELDLAEEVFVQRTVVVAQLQLARGSHPLDHRLEEGAVGQA